ncbi:MAG: HEAT repeat domain-containing protein [Planctomycetota bacterium]
MRIQTLFVLSCAATLPRAQSSPTDLELWVQRYARVEAELRAADVGDLDPAQRAGRQQVIEWLRDYRLRADFGVDPDFPDARVPSFVDREGRRCAIAYMLDRSGRDALTREIAATQNHAWFVELAGDPRVRAWTDAHGLSLVEAARIQAPGRWRSWRARSAATPEPPARWAGPEDIVRRGRVAGPRAASAPAPVAAGRPGATAGRRTPRGVPAIELDWQAWWRANRAAYVQRDRSGEAVDTPVRLFTARRAARDAVVPELVRLTEHQDASLRAAATLALGRLGDERHVPVLRRRLQDPQQEIRSWTLLALGALGGPRATFELASVAGAAAHDPAGLGPQARAFAVLGLALARDHYDDGFVRAVSAGHEAQDDVSLRMGALLYAGMADPDVFAGEAERLQTDRDLLLRGRALENLGSVPTDAAVATLTHALSGRNRSLRRSAALGLGRSAHDLALPALKTAYDLEREHLSRGVVLLAIGAHREPDARRFLVQELRRGPKSLRSWAALGLGLHLRQGTDEDAAAELRAALGRERNDSATPAYMLGMGLARDALAVPALAEALSTEREASMRIAAGDALALIGDDEARATLRAHVKADPCPTTRATLAELLVGIGTDADVEAVVKSLRVAETDAERALLTYALGARFTPRSFAVLRDRASDARTDPRLRAAAVQALGRMLDESPAYRFAELTRGSNWQLLPEWLDWLVQSTL